MKGKLEKIDMSRSFTTKMCFWMLVTSLCVFLICFGTAQWFAQRQMLADGHQKANLELDKALQYIDEEMTEIETAAKNFESMLPRDEVPTPDKVYSLCRKFLTTNPGIQGVAMGFEPGVYAQYPHGFAPYMMRQADGSYKTTLLNEHYSYRDKEWYRATRQADSARWSNPFTEVNGSIICSYCVPLHNSAGQLLGVLAVDLSLEELTEHVQKIKPYPNSFLTVMDRNLNFVVHPDKHLLLRGNPLKVLDRGKYEVNETIFIDIRKRVRGKGAFGEQGARKFLYYAPINRAGWTVTLECAQDEILADANAIRRQMIVISILGIMALVGATVSVMRRFLRPIRLYALAARSIADGNFHTHLPKMRDHNELWRLGNSLDYMQHSLDRYVAELRETTREKGRIESELNIASQIQMAMIPKIFPPYPDRDDVDIYGTLIPAKDVGGDLYDFFLRDEKLFFCIGDVSGKGVPASLVMAVTRSLVRIVAARESHPDRIISALNESMADMNESNMFVTMFMGVLDLPTGRFRYCNAGHNAPVLLSPGQGEVQMLDVLPNLPVAVIPGTKFVGQETVIPTGTTIFLYTDGLTEAENSQKELFGDGRMLAQLRATAHATAREQVEGMLQAVHAHVGDAEQSDDLTMLSVRYKRIHRETKYYKQLLFKNNVSETPKLAVFMDDIIGEIGISNPLASSLNLALEEAIVNVMNYAYPTGTTGDIMLETFANDARIKFVITDSGAPFDPTAAEEVDPTASLDDRPIGGLGIFLVRNIMDSVNYERVDGKNVLTLRKNFGPGTKLNIVNKKQ